MFASSLSLDIASHRSVYRTDRTNPMGAIEGPMEEEVEVEVEVEVDGNGSIVIIDGVGDINLGAAGITCALVVA
jgi:hypothetical protein